MKLTGAEAQRYIARPDPGRAGLLLFGADPMRVALKRQQAVIALIGPEGAAEMRLERIAGAELRRNGAALQDAMRASGFFPGQRVVLVDDATDTTAPVCADALKDWRAGDAVLVVTAGALAAKSALRKAFETQPNAVAIGIYDDPPGRDEIAADLARAGLGSVAPAAMEDLIALSRALDPGDFRQTVEKLGLYCLGQTTPVGPEDVAACAPATIRTDADDLIDSVADARLGDLAGLLSRIASQGVTPVSVCIAALRHFRALHAAASDPGGAVAGVSRLRPPVFGPRRDRMARQAGTWGRARLEEALGLLIETDLALRSSARAPQQALMERSLIRLCMLARK